jgi:beta-mannanase
MRPFPEFDRNVQWWASQPPAEFTAVWREMVTYIRGKGVNNVLWVFNLGGGVMDAMHPAQVPGYIDSYYPGSDYVDIVSMDCYPPSSANAPTIAALTALNKPVIYAEMGAVKGNPLPAPFTGDTGVAVATVISNFPQVVAAVVWGSTEALPEQHGMSGYMNNSKMINLDGLPRL